MLAGSPARQRLEEMQRGLAVDMKQLLGEVERIRATVAFDFAVIRLEGDAVDPAVAEERGRRFLDRFPHGGDVAGAGRLQSPAQVMIGIAVADEEPAIDSAFVDEGAAEWPDGLEDDAVGGGWARVDFHVDPRRAGERVARHGSGRRRAIRTSGDPLEPAGSGSPVIGTTISCA